MEVGWVWMGERFINVDRETPMLLPPDLREWVADNDLVLLIVDAVELCDLSGVSRSGRGTGSAQYPPGMMMALLIYGYASGIFSSRRLERATYDCVVGRGWRRAWCCPECLRRQFEGVV